MASSDNQNKMVLLQYKKYIYKEIQNNLSNKKQKKLGKCPRDTDAPHLVHEWTDRGKTHHLDII